LAQGETKRHWSGLGGLEQTVAQIDDMKFVYVTLYRHTSRYAHASDPQHHLFRKPGDPTLNVLVLPGLDEQPRVPYFTCVLLYELATYPSALQTGICGRVALD
jgi:hypothetical protein